MQYYRFALNVLLWSALTLFPVILFGEATMVTSGDEPPPELGSVTDTTVPSGTGLVDEPHNMTTQSSWMTVRELVLSISILVFGLATLMIQYQLLRHATQGRTEEVAKTFIVTLIILGTLLLLGSGFDDRTISPALGLFGTIAGYLLGKTGIGPGPTDSALPTPNRNARDNTQSKEIDI